MRRRPDKSPSQGVQEAHSDFLYFLYSEHGDSCEDYIGNVEAISGLPREKMTNYGLQCWYWLKIYTGNIFSLISRCSGIPKVAYILTGVVALYLIIGAAAQIVCNLIGFAYPAYVSVKAVRSQDTKDDTQWLIYWCVFATFSIIDFFAGAIMQYFPFYYLSKALFLIYLFLPQTMGAHYLFYKYVDPMVTMIDECISKRKKT